MSDTTFLLCIGAQKAGTTWLQGFLATQAEADFGVRKEYSVLNKLDRGSLRHEISAVRSGFAERCCTPAVTGVVSRDLNAYADYFGSVAAREDVRLTGDFSPAYTGLSEAMLQRAVSALKARGMKVRAVYLMRDPVERECSAVRMHRKKPEKFRQHMAQFGDGSEEEHLLAMATTPEFRNNGNYRSALARLRLVFGEADLYVGLYEELFQVATIAKLSGFLEMPLAAPDFTHNPNPSPKTAQLSKTARNQLSAQMRDAVAFGIETFGQDRIHALWPTSRRQAV